MIPFDTTKSCSFYSVALLIIYSDCMSSAKRKKTKIIDTEEAEQQIELETGYIYDGTQRGEMLKPYGITAAENFFMQGR